MIGDLGDTGMTSWDITPSGVHGVLNKTRGTAGDLANKISTYTGDLASAASAAGTLSFGGKAKSAAQGEGASGGPVGAALAEFSEKTQNDLVFLVARAMKSVSGATDATLAYIQGDTEMAANSQHTALGAPDLKKFAAEAERLNGDGGKQGGK
ncbi:DUF6507 family protein [Streptomyces sp. NPDC003077]|uniref:DUF6507 family protein n=1 Tax=Streptomyces sp. NPDC003077 TaxID=3154443 RepID=UPI0033BB3C70